MLWWDEREKSKGAAEPGTNRGTTPSQTADAVKAEDYGLDRDTIHRWRKRLKDPKNFDEALESAEKLVSVRRLISVSIA